MKVTEFEAVLHKLNGSMPRKGASIKKEMSEYLPEQLLEIQTVTSGIMELTWNKNGLGVGKVPPRLIEDFVGGLHNNGIKLKVVGSNSATVKLSLGVTSSHAQTPAATKRILAKLIKKHLKEWTDIGADKDDFELGMSITTPQNKVGKAAFTVLLRTVLLPVLASELEDIHLELYSMPKGTVLKTRRWEHVSNIFAVFKQQTKNENSSDTRCSFKLGNFCIALTRYSAHMYWPHTRAGVAMLGAYLPQLAELKLVLALNTAGSLNMLPRASVTDETVLKTVKQVQDVCKTLKKDKLSGIPISINIVLGTIKTQTTRVKLQRALLQTFLVPELKKQPRVPLLVNMSFLAKSWGLEEESDSS